ncbi:MAG TPA: AI-2E family transporter [Steroidobacteraceae bacterium]|nr:AI-2E family transporter [Steroidobacteraceae bacterium]
MTAPPPGEAALTFYRRTFAVAVVVILAILLYRVLEPFLAPLAWAVVLAFLMHPLQVRLTRLCRQRAGLAAGLLTVLTFLVFVGPLTIVGGAFASEAALLVASLQKLVTDLKIGSVQDLARLPAAQDVLVWLQQHLAVSADQLRGWIASGAEHLLEPLAALGGQAFLGAVGTVVNFTLMLFLLFFLLRDGVAMLDAALGLVPLAANRRAELAAHIGNVTRAVVFGTLVTSALQGLSVTVAFELVGLPSPVVFGALAAVLSVLPVGGTAFVWGPAAMWLFTIGRVGAGVFLLLWGVIIVGVADNLLRPLLISGRTQVPTLAVFVGVLGGLAAFGLVGMFLGPLLISMAIVLVRFADVSLASR